LASARAWASGAGGPAGVMFARLRAGAARVRNRGRDPGQVAAERGVPPPRERVPVDRARILACAGLQGGGVGDVQQLARGRRAAVLALPRPCEFAFFLAYLHGPGGVGVHLRLADAADLVAAPVRTRDPVHAELARQLALHRRGGDRLERAEDRADAHGVQGAPFAVAEGAGDPGDLVVDVVLGVAVAAGALQPGGDDEPGGLEPARLAAVDAGAVVAGAGDPGPGLQVLQRGPVGPVQDLLEPLLPPGPVHGRLLAASHSRAALVLPEGGVQHRDGLGERDRDVVVGGGLPGGPGGFAFEFDEPFGGGVRLGRHEPGQVIGERRVTAAGPTQFGPGARVGLLVGRVVSFAVDGLAQGEAEGLGAGSPPAAGWFSGLGGVEVVPAGGALGGVVLGFPDVAEVVALGDGDDYGQYGGLLSRGGDVAAGLPMIISVNATVCVIEPG
jgi:hypothetical protein